MHLQEMWARIECLKIAKELELSKQTHRSAGSVAEHAERLWGFVVKDGKLDDCDCHKQKGRAEAEAAHAAAGRTLVLPFGWTKAGDGTYNLTTGDRKFCTLSTPAAGVWELLLNLPGAKVERFSGTPTEAMRSAVARLFAWANNNPLIAEEIINGIQGVTNGTA